MGLEESGKRPPQNVVHDEAFGHANLVSLAVINNARLGTINDQ
jgi:hypothetical protein